MALGVQTLRVGSLKRDEIAEKAQIASYKAAESAARTKAALTAREQANVSKAAQGAFAGQQAGIQTTTRTIIRRVPDVITAEIDRGFPLSIGFVRLHDAAAGGIELSAVPVPAGKSDGDAAGVTASDAAAVIAGNYGAAHECVAQLTGLQAWIRNEAAADK